MKTLSAEARPAVAVVAALLALAPTAHALNLDTVEFGQFEFGMGVGSDLHSGDSAGLWLGASLNPRRFFGLAVQPHLGLLALDQREQRNGRARGDTLLVLVENRILWRNFYFSSGFAMRDHDTDALSTRFNFVNGVGWSLDAFGLAVRHISNAGTGGLNRGENTLMVTYRW